MRWRAQLFSVKRTVDSVAGETRFSQRKKLKNKKKRAERNVL